jgi:hypothetical protein
MITCKTQVQTCLCQHTLLIGWRHNQNMKHTLPSMAYISPVSKRRDGGGYEPFDPTDANSQAELRRQAGTSLAAWLERFRGCAEHIGLDMTPLENIVHTLRDDKNKAVGE